MKIIKCFVENFGVLSGYQVNFDEGLTTIKEDNGKGKTTLAVFIKSMFYGLKTSRKSDLNENERAKYTPWQGGNFGGYLDFYVNNTNYRVQRYFGKSPKEDTFSLTNLETGKESLDYSANLGEDIFGIDEPGFSGSTFLSGDVLCNNMPTSIGAKLCKLVSDDNDLNDFDSALSRLREKKKFYKAERGSGGAISELKSEIFDLNRKIEHCTALEANMVTLSGELKALCEEKELFGEKLAAIRGKMELAMSAQTDSKKKEVYNSLLAEVNALSEAQKKILGRFEGGLPKEDVVTAIRALIDESNKNKEVINLIKNENVEETLEKKKQKEFFGENVPSSESVSLIESQIARQDVLKESLENIEVSPESIEKFKELKEFFEESPPTLNTLNEIERKIVRLNSPPPPKKTPKISIVLWIVAGVLFLAGALLAGAAFGGTQIGIFSIPISIAAAGVGAVLALIPLLTKPKNVSSLEREEAVALSNEVLDFIAAYLPKDTDPEEALAQITVKAREYEQLADTVARQAGDIKAKKGEIEEIKLGLDAFFTRYFSENDGNYPEMLKTIKANLMSLGQTETSLTSSKTKLEEYTALLKNSIEKIVRLFGSVGWSPAATEFGKALDEIAALKKEYALFEEQKAAKVKLAQEYYINEGIAKLTKQFPKESIEELKPVEQKLIESISEQDNKVIKLRQRINEISVEIEPQSEYSALIEAHSERLEQYTVNFAALEGATAILNKAKDEITKKYLGKTYESFRKYVDIISQGDIGEFSIDTDLNLYIVEQGIKRETAYYSSGYKNVFDIALKLALIESLFEGEKPFLIIDDPFTNMDDEKVKKSFELINSLAGEMQIIYLVCHSSRC